MVKPIFYTFADVAVLRSENTSDKKSIVYNLSLKEGFLCGIYKNNNNYNNNNNKLAPYGTDGRLVLTVNLKVT